MATRQSSSVDSATRREVLLLMAASFATVLVLLLSIAESASLPALGHLGMLKLRHLLITLIVAAAGILAAAALWRGVAWARSTVADAQRETAEMRRHLTAVEAVLHGEPQALVFWPHGSGPTVVVHNLESVTGLPASREALLQFGTWLDHRSALELKASLDALFGEARPFNLLLKTVAGGHLEADGRTAGGRAVLRFRDIVGHKHDLMRILDQHRQLARDIKASRALLEALPMPAWLKGADGRLEWVNAAYVAAVDGGSAQEVIGGQIELLETRQRDTVERVLQSGQAYRKRASLIVGGERKSHDLIVLGLGDVTTGAAVDVGALEAAKGQLDRQMATYDRTLDRVATAVAIFSRERRLTFFNQAYLKLWNLDRDWLLTRPADGEILDRLRELSRLPAVVDYRQWRQNWLKVYLSGSEVEDWWHLPDGRMVHVVGEPRPDGGVTYLYDDRTERLALESRYKTLNDAQRETLDSLKEGVAVFSTDGRLKLFNSAFAGIWKLSRSALGEGPHIDAIIRQTRVLHDDDRVWSQLSRAVTSFTDEREPSSGQMTRADGSVIEYATTPLPDGATMITFVDVTVAKSYERALIERNDALVAADRLKSQFLSHVSYELRTPLTAIIGFSEMLMSPALGRLTPKQHEYMSDIDSSSKTLLAIIDDILDLASIDAGALELKLAPARVQTIVDAAILGVQEHAQRAQVRIEVALAADVSEIVADEARMRQVLYNLLTNAIGFSKAGGRVGVTCWRDRDMIALAVEDAGIGIPRDQQPNVFDRFISRSQGSKHRGAGLGLSIVKSIVELHGGAMVLESEPGAGTRVTVRLPERLEHAATNPRTLEHA
jgi:signal transduction histidine kinase